jgi:hypothetical protein
VKLLATRGRGPQRCKHAPAPGSCSAASGPSLSKVVQSAAVTLGQCASDGGRADNALLRFKSNTALSIAACTAQRSDVPTPALLATRFSRLLCV